MTCWLPQERAGNAGRCCPPVFRSAGSAHPMRSPRPWCFSPPTTAATSRERNCLWTAASHKCRPIRAETAREEFMLRSAISIGSTRPGRKGKAVAKWVYESAQKRSDAEIELVDIKDFDLRLLDEPVSPIMGQYIHQHTKTWSEKIA